MRVNRELETIFQRSPSRSKNAKQCTHKAFTTDAAARDSDGCVHTYLVC